MARNVARKRHEEEGESASEPAIASGSHMRPPDLFFVWWPYVFFVARFKSRCSEMRHTPSSKWRAERLLVQLPTYRGPEAKRAATAQSSSLNELDDDAMRAVLVLVVGDPLVVQPACRSAKRWAFLAMTLRCSRAMRASSRDHALPEDLST